MTHSLFLRQDSNHDTQLVLRQDSNHDTQLVPQTGLKP